jgi:hypothetical protein
VKIAKERNQETDLRISHGSKRVSVRENRGMTATADNKWTYDSEEVCDVYFKAHQQRKRGQHKIKGGAQKQQNGFDLLLDLGEDEEMLYQAKPTTKQQIQDDALVTQELQVWADQQLDQQIAQSQTQSEHCMESSVDEMRANFVQSVSSISDILQGPEMSQPIVDLFLQHLAYCVQTYAADDTRMFSTAFLQQYVWGAHPDFQQTCM